MTATANQNLPASAIKPVQRALMRWFKNAARDLPWRRTQDPYAILVSEIMLQQTQVATVIPYFERWLTRFPDFSALAAAEETEVLGLWQGLGYYSRARNLHRAAKQVVQQHGGTMPSDAALIRALPGVGRYTAGAVASFAFNLPEPLVDANVARVLARVLDLAEPVASTKGQRALWDAATALVPKIDAAHFNGALMELGAILCTARNPQCPECPIRAHCAAHAAGTVEQRPIKKVRPKLTLLEERCAWVFHRGRILLEQQTGSRWHGLWKLPLLPIQPRSKPLLALDYPFTHHRITLTIFADTRPTSVGKSCAWFSAEQLGPLPLTSPHRRAIKQLLARHK